MDGIQLYGNQTLKLSASDDKGKKTGWIFLDTIASNPMVVPQRPMISQDPSADLEAFNAASSARMLESRKHKLADGIQLNEVTIRDAPKTIILRDQTVQSFGYPEYYFDITAKDNTYKDLEDFIVHKVPGAQTNPDTSSGVIFYFQGKKYSPGLL